jgi:thymidylate synthase
MYIEMQSLRHGYAELGHEIMRRGWETSPRGEKTVEVLGASFACAEPADSLPINTGRGVVKALAAAETLQLIGGFHDPEMLVRTAPHFQAFLDTDGRQRAPYGPRLGDQIPVAIEHLKSDPDSRQAQVTIWNPALDNQPDLHDYPCTTSLQWFIRNGRLHMQTHMRSNDFWLGVPYDVFMFTQLQLTIAKILGIEPGTYRHSAASLHVYEKHWDDVVTLTAPKGDAPPTYGITAAHWYEAATRARSIHNSDKLPDNPTAGERWLHLSMAGARG